METVLLIWTMEFLNNSNKYVVQKRINCLNMEGNTTFILRMI